MTATTKRILLLLYHQLTIHNSHDAEVFLFFIVFRSGCRNVSQCRQQQFFLELH